MTLKNIIITGSLLGAASLVQADDRTFGDGTLPEFLEQFDVNEDGRIDEEERQAIKEHRRTVREERRSAIDTDDNGKISREELEAARDALRERIATKRAEKFNEIAGEDGKMSLEEFSSIPGLSNAPEERLEALFARLDTDESGFVELEEFSARLRSPLPPRFPRPGGGDERPGLPNRGEN